MEIGAIVTTREVDAIRRRLRKIGALSSDRRIREQARLILCAIDQADRRARRHIKKTEPKLF
jgi:hypothetical protein